MITIKRIHVTNTGVFDANIPPYRGLRNIANTVIIRQKDWFYVTFFLNCHAPPISVFGNQKNHGNFRSTDRI